MPDTTSPTQSYHGWEELFRVIETQSITEDGVYKVDHTPEIYKGSGVLDVDVVHWIIMVDDGGRLQRFAFDIAEALDEEDLLGGAVNLDGTEIKAAPGPSEVATELTREYSGKLFAANPNKFNKGFAMAKQAGYVK